jgi:hypothetical protein
MNKDLISSNNRFGNNTLYKKHSSPRALIIIYKKESAQTVYDPNAEGSGSDTLSQWKSDLSKYDNFQTIKSQLKIPKNQINALKNYIGFNMSEIAAILNVRRPTIYEWLETEVPNLRENNRKRLDEVYRIYEKWANTNLGRLDSYLRKTIIGNKSLFDLLSCKKINRTLVDKALFLLEQTIKSANSKKELSDNFITKHKLEERTKKHIRRKLKRHRSIG